ncbi:SDR family oxidoreductase [Sphingopyxis yananensis]|uniref:SDR family oxidoreductase n=1 Tax=Sphingopyxis yananensis TaxID=2886687 RepID=UPI001D1026E0|nr:SDR family oxidoreductase [Sphingopyxis yananensis]MCC2603740.1 SDR family oxidoreductase [Sphingopyxis yananensis]
MILKDKVIIITGAGPGMGQAMCHGAAVEGAKVVITARSVDAIEAAAADIRANGGEAIAVRCDVSSADDCQAVAKAALDQWGRIDGLVNSAYYHPDWSVLENQSIDQLLQAFDVNAAGPLRMTQAVLPAMKAQKSGSIVNVSTLATRKANPAEGAYAMSKAALAQMTRQLVTELSGSGIRFNTALMGWMMGAPLQAYYDSLGAEGPAAMAQRASEIPIGHIPPDKDCAKAIYFLLSDYASEVTGASLDINGGDWYPA